MVFYLTLVFYLVYPCSCDGANVITNLKSREGDLMIARISFIVLLIALVFGACMPFAASAQQPLKVGLIIPMTGPMASTGKQVDAAVKLYVAEHGDVVAGRKIEVLLRDDANAPETTKRYAQELVTNDHAEILAGFGLTPLAFAAAPIATAAKVPMIVMSAGTFVIPQKSPYIMRTSFTLPQNTAPIAVWAAKHGIKKVFTLVVGLRAGHRFRDDLQERVHSERRPDRRRGTCARPES